MPTREPERHQPFEVAFDRLREIILDGLRHGFFACEVTCEVVNGRKRRLVIRAGKSHQFTISEEELPGI